MTPEHPAQCPAMIHDAKAARVVVTPDVVLAEAVITMGLAAPGRTRAVR